MLFSLFNMRTGSGGEREKPKSIDLTDMASVFFTANAKSSAEVRRSAEPDNLTDDRLSIFFSQENYQTTISRHFNC